MTEIIKKTIIDFKDLVENNENIIQLNFQSDLINELNNEFTGEEQRWFIANFYVFLNYHPTEDFPINLENVYNMIGFANKGNAKRTLINNFEENKDFKLVVLNRENNFKDTERQLLRREKLGGSGLLHEKVLLTVDTFKTLCMLAKTDKGKKIRSYYVKLENINNKILKKQMEENNKILKKQMEENNNKLIEKENELIKNQAQNKIKVENTLKNSFNKRKVVYLIKIYDNDNLYKFGYTDDIVARLRTHKHKIGDDIELIYCIESENNKELEQELKKYLNKYNFRTNKIINKVSQTELLIINDISIIKNALIDLNSNIHDDKLLILKLKTQIVDLERELAKTTEQKIQELENTIICLKTENLKLKQDIMDLKLSKNNEDKEIIKNKDIVEDRLHKKSKVDKIDPETLQIIETYECISAIITTDTDYSYNQIYRSIKNNNIYKNFRWNYSGLQINPTNKEMKIGKKIKTIVQLNNLHQFVKIYHTKKELADELKIYSRKLAKIIEEGMIFNDYYYITEENYKLKFDNPDDTQDKIGKYKTFNSKQIKETNIQTNEIIIYNSMNDVWSKRGITRSCLRDCIKNNRICSDKYKWEYINPEQNKNNAKRIQEINQQTNEIIIYNSMKEVYKARNIKTDQLRNCIKNDVKHNEFKYQEL